MPELPDLEVYRRCLDAKAHGQVLRGLRIASPFLLRTVTPRPADFAGRRFLGTDRLGKRLVLRFDGGLAAIVHLMILGRLHWKPANAAIPRSGGLAAWDFDAGSLLLTESGKKRRASLHLVASEAEVAAQDRGGVEVVDVALEDFRARLTLGNHTLKRALTDPRLFAGIGNAYSDEILHRARLSPFKQTQAMGDDEHARLHAAVQATLAQWTQHLQREADAHGGWPRKVTAFHPEMAVHGRYRLPCPDCGAPVQRIVHAANESNYCARCQTENRLLADRALSRLLHDSWPKTLEED